jgi:ribonuclease HII
MKTFQFPLQNVMDWHCRSAEVERTELERLHNEKHQVLKLRVAVQHELERLHSMRATAECVRAHELSQLAEYEASLHIRKAHMQVQETVWDSRIAEQRQKCIETDRKFRLLERFKERRKGEWQREFDRETENIAAGSYIAKWVRDSRSEAANSSLKILK